MTPERFSLTFFSRVPPSLGWCGEGWNRGCYISLRFLLRCVCVSTPSVAHCNICQCLSVRGCLAAVQTLFGWSRLLLMWFVNESGQAEHRGPVFQTKGGVLSRSNLISQTSFKWITHMLLGSVDRASVPRGQQRAPSMGLAVLATIVNRLGR